MTLLEVMGFRGGRPDGAPSVWEDLWSGRAGWAVRGGLSLAATAALLGAGLIVVGTVEALSGRVGDATAAVVMASVGVAWCVALGSLWWSYRRGQRLVRTIFAVLGVWLVIIPLTVVLDVTVRRAEPIIVGVVFLGVAATITLIATVAYRGLGGRAVQDPDGEVHVNCPSCRYSMVGLASCTCPECGTAYTIDQIIRGQDYAVLRRRTPPGAGETDRPAEGPAGERADTLHLEAS